MYINMEGVIQDHGVSPGGGKMENIKYVILGVKVRYDWTRSTCLC